MINEKLTKHFRNFLKDDTLEINVKFLRKTGQLQLNISVDINDTTYPFNYNHSLNLENMLEICRQHSLDAEPELIKKLEYDLPDIYQKEILKIKLDILTIGDQECKIN